MKSALSIIVLIIIVILVAQFIATYLSMRSQNRGRFGSRAPRKPNARDTSASRDVLENHPQSMRERASYAIDPNDEMQLLRDAYESWSVAREQMNIIIRAINSQSRSASVQRENARNIYEARAILERWYISSQNFAQVTIDASSDITRKMRQEFLDKRIFYDNASDRSRDVDHPRSGCNLCDVDRVIDQLLHVVPDLAPSSTGAHIDDDGIISFGAFKATYLPARIELMRKIARDRGYSDARIITTALRYASLVPSGQQWSLPPAVYDLLVSQYGATLEGFASPFNSQIMRYIAQDPSRYAFCSIFPDTDAAFGSCGSFFNCDLHARVSVINPPYIIDILDATVRKCHKTLSAQTSGDETCMFIIVPSWTDAQFYNELLSSRWMRQKIINERNAHYFVDASARDRAIVASFGTTIFVLSNVAREDFDQIAQVMRDLSK